MNNHKVNVLLVHNYYQYTGGEDIVVANEKLLLEKNGHNVILYSRHNNELKKLSGYQKLFLPFTTIFSLKTYREIKKIIKEYQIEIVHVHNTLTLISPSVYYAALAMKVPIVQTIHNFRLLCPAATFYRNNKNNSGEVCELCIKKGLFNAVKYSCYRDSKLQTFASVITLRIHRMLGIYRKIHYITLTEFNKKKLLQLNSKNNEIIKGNSVFVKPNYAEEYSYMRLSFNERKKQFVFVGRLEKIKGIRLLLEAWKKICDYELIICGTGPDKNWCENYILNNGMTNVKILGFVENNIAKKLIAESQALILPTQWYEGFPMTIVESLSSGTPVIGSDLGNVGSLIKEGVNGLTFKYNSIDSLIESVNRITDMVDSSFDCYENNYNEKSNYHYLNSIYKKIIIEYNSKSC
ncbi:glycosyltransferase [Ureibacillus chungkukjangi]|uniref:glycosyltransferase n=1 Tax=Ureibacillus chungkukjangi TaxID=1202712 RepID=UPI00384F8928